MLRIATFNVNSVRSRRHILERWLPLSNPDLLFLQETKVINDEFPVEFFDAMGYKVFFNGEKSYNGVAAVIKSDFYKNIDIKNINFGLNDGDTPNFDTRVLSLKLNSPYDIFILNTYVPQGKFINHADFKLKKVFLRRVRKIIEREIAGRFIWIGDLNVAPYEIDVAHPDTKLRSVCFAPDIRECFHETVQGLTDLFRKFNPELEAYTFFDYRVKDAINRNLGWRVDNILASPSLVNYAENCFIDHEPRLWERPSDHTPLVADLNF